MPDEPRDDLPESAEKDLEKRLRELLGDEDADGYRPADPNPRFEPLPDPEEIELTLRERDDEKLSQIHHGLDAAKERTRSELDNAEAELEQRMRLLGERVDRQKEIREGQKAIERRARDADQSSARGLGIGLSIAYTIIGVPLVGAGVGWLVDQQVGTNVWKGYGMLIGAVLGIVMALYLLNRSNNQR